MNRLILSILGVLLLASTPSWADPVVAKIKNFPLRVAYAKQPFTLDGSESTGGGDVTYQWSVKSDPSFDGEPALPNIEDADKPVAHFTPPAWGIYNFELTVTRGAEKTVARNTAHIINDPAKDDSPNYDGEKKILYKEATDLLGGRAKLYLHIFNPEDWKTSDKRGAVLLFHGGGWSGGTPDRYLADAKYWASRGLVGIMGQYRLGAHEGTQPSECVADAKSAVRYLRAHAAELGIDPEKIAVGGESAGAHIAAAAGTLPAYDDPADDLRVNCVPNALLLYFPYAMVNTRGNKKDDMSPLHFVTPSTPPTLFIAGEMDGIAPAQNGIEWGNLMQNGPTFRLFIYRKAHHPSGRHDMTKPGVENDMIRQTDLFLVSLGFMAGNPTVPPMSPPAVAQLHVDPKEFKPTLPNEK